MAETAENPVHVALDDGEAGTGGRAGTGEQATLQPRWRDAAIDSERKMTTTTLMCCCMILTLGFAGTLAFLVPAGIYSVDLIMSNRASEVDSYNAVVDTWTTGRSAAFAALDSTYRFEALFSSGPATALTLVTGAPGNVNGPIALESTSDVTSYATTAFFSTSTTLNPLNVSSFNGNIGSSNMTVNMYRKSDNALMSSINIAAPVVFHTLLAADCSGVLQGKNCKCPGPYQFNTNSRKCEQWVQLNQLCLNIGVTNGQMQLGLNTDVGAGCALNPAGLKLGSGEVVAYAPVPQLDTCVPSSVNNVGPFGYSFLNYNPQPNAAFPLLIAPTVVLRGNGDPYPAAMAFSKGARNTQGQISFGTLTSVLIGRTAGFWSAAFLCLVILVLYVSCVCFKFFDEPLERSHENPSLRRCRPCIRGCGTIIAKSRGSHCVTSFAAAGVVMFFLLIIIGFIAIYSYLALVLLDAPYVCAYKTVSCTSSDILVSCGTLKDLQFSSSLGAATRGLNLTAIFFALFPAGIFMCSTGVSFAARSATSRSLTLPFLCALVICLPLSAFFQIIASIIYGAGKSTITQGYCDYIASDFLTPSYCTTVPRTEAALTAQTVLGSLAAGLSFCLIIKQLCFSS